MSAETVRAALAAAVASGNVHRRDQLMVYAYQRGVTVRELMALTGYASTSRVHHVVARAERGAVLDDPAPPTSSACNRCGSDPGRYRCAHAPTAACTSYLDVGASRG